MSPVVATKQACSSSAVAELMRAIYRCTERATRSLPQSCHVRYGPNMTEGVDDDQTDRTYAAVAESTLPEDAALTHLHRWLDRRIRSLRIFLVVVLLVSTAGHARGSQSWQEGLLSAVSFLVIVGGLMWIAMSRGESSWDRYRAVERLVPAHDSKLRDKRRVNVVLADGTELTWALRSRRRANELREGMPLWLSHPAARSEPIIAVTVTQEGQPVVLEPEGEAWPPSRWN